MADGVEESSAWEEVGRPTYLRQVDDLKFVNVSIKGHERKTSTGFPKEEYFAYHVVSILTDASVEVPGGLASMDPEEESKKTRHESWRRYSEFEALRTFLCTVYPYVVVPPLPEKAVRNSSSILSKITFTGEDTGFLLKRQQALELFLVRVSRHPVLSKNYWFHQFMHNIGWKEAVQQTGYTAKADSLLQTLTLQLSKQKLDSRFQDVREYADDLEAAFKSLLQIRERSNDRVKAIYKVHSNYGRIFSEWSDLEGSSGMPLQAAGGILDSYSDSVDNYIDEEELRFLLPLKEYLGYCDALRAVVRRQEALQRIVEKAEEAQATKSEAKLALQNESAESGGGTGSRFSLRGMAVRLRGGDTSYEARLTLAARELQEAEQNRDEAKSEQEKFMKLSIEDLERFHTQKVADFRSILINYAQLQMHIHRKGVSTWERVKGNFAN